VAVTTVRCCTGQPPANSCGSGSGGGGAAGGSFALNAEAAAAAAASVVAAAAAAKAAAAAAVSMSVTAVAAAAIDTAWTAAGPSSSAPTMEPGCWLLLQRCGNEDGGLEDSSCLVGRFPRRCCRLRASRRIPAAMVVLRRPHRVAFRRRDSIFHPILG